MSVLLLNKDFYPAGKSAFESALNNYRLKIDKFNKSIGQAQPIAPNDFIDQIVNQGFEYVFTDKTTAEEEELKQIEAQKKQEKEELAAAEKAKIETEKAIEARKKLEGKPSEKAVEYRREEYPQLEALTVAMINALESLHNSKVDWSAPTELTEIFEQRNSVKKNGQK